SRNTVAYTATKFAVRGITKVAALELAPRQIRVNSIHPGYVATPMLDAATAGEANSHAARIPLGELSEPEDVANMALFLASDDVRRPHRPGPGRPREPRVARIHVCQGCGDG